MSTPAERRASLAEVVALFNGYSAQFGPVAERVFAIPEHKPALSVLQAIADTANAGIQHIRDLIAVEGGLDPVPPLDVNEDALGKTLINELTALLQAFEAHTHLQVLELALERVDGEVRVSDFTLVR